MNPETNIESNRQHFLTELYDTAEFVRDAGDKWFVTEPGYELHERPGGAVSAERVLGARVAYAQDGANEYRISFANDEGNSVAIEQIASIAGDVSRGVVLGKDEDGQLREAELGDISEGGITEQAGLVQYLDKVIRKGLHTEETPAIARYRERLERQAAAVDTKPMRNLVDGATDN